MTRTVKIGLDHRAFADALDGAETGAERNRAVEDADGLGAFGVPTFVFDGRLFWDSDRLMLPRQLERPRPGF